MAYAIKRQPNAVATLVDSDLVRVSDATDGNEKKCTVADLAHYVTEGGGVDVNVGVTAFATGGQANAVALMGGLNVVATCATAGDSVRLIAEANSIEVLNNGAEDCAIYPETGSAIDSYGTNGAYYLASGSTQKFVRTSETTWTRVNRSLRYVDRGTVTAWDFDKTDMTVQDGSYNAISLAAIVPLSAAGNPINARVLINDTTTNALTLRDPDTTSTINVAAVASGSLGANVTQDGVVRCDAAREVEYRIVLALGAPDDAQFAVRGWWVEG